MSNLMRWDDPSTSSSRPRWSSDNRAVARIERDTRLTAVQEQNRSRLNMFKAELRELETEQFITNATRLMNRAKQECGDDPSMLAEMRHIVQNWARVEDSIYRADHNPYLR
ncbi:hypothetical protein AB0H71_28790 [Nocardia sp. NPDC050697]|uniref:hypothetical protein n=1 Tax=Nocardia sp. NPDC050697 TaxID=3155158 RepID=UPI0033CD4713